MSHLKKLATHFSKYLSLRIVSMGVSLFTFPIITRLFSVSEYGIFALANTTIAVLIAFSKSGLSTAFNRRFPEYSGKMPGTLYSTSFWLQIQSSAIFTVAYITVVLLIRNYIGEFNTKIFLLVGPLLILRSLQSLLLGFFRAEENIRAFNTASLAFKVGMGAGGIIGALLINERIIGFFLGVLVIECTISLILIVQRKKNIAIHDFSKTLGKQLLYYGAPLIVFELSSMVLSIADRYQIQYYLGSESLGVYAASYNLSTYMQESITGPLWMAIFPIYTKIWQHEGPEQTRQFLSKCLKYYFAIAIPMVFGITIIGRDIITLLASEKYAAASIILPWVLAGQLIHGMYHIVAAGIYLHQKTKHVAIATGLSAILNIGLNFFLIPRYGILGAAYSTFISYIILIVAITADSFTFLSLRIPVKEIFVYIVFSAVTLLIIRIPNFESVVARLAFAGVFGLTIYLLMMISYDRPMRLYLFKLLNIKSTP